MDGGEQAQSRSRALLGEAGMARLRAARVLVVGIGGVGSWCAEALARTGVGGLTLVDGDRVAISNLNRQCEATVGSLGELKTEAMRRRIAGVAPECRVETVARRIAGFGDLGEEDGGYDFIVDAIDDVSAKAELILGAQARGIPIVSSMGAAKRLDSTRVRIVRFDRIEGDGLARALRQRFKRIERFPKGKFECAVSDEAPAAIGEMGSVMPVTAAFGLALASRVIAGLCGASPGRP